MAKLIYKENEIKYEGEKTFSKALDSYLDDTYIVYHNREVNGLEFDFCILVPNKGIIIVEVKGWHETDDIKAQNDGQICVNLKEGQIIADPRKQARNCRFALLNTIERKTGQRPTVLHMVAYPFLSERFYDAHQMNVNTEKYQVFFKDDIGNMDHFVKKLSDIFTRHSLIPGSSFGEALSIKIRKIFEPDIISTTNEESKDIDPALKKGSYLYSWMQTINSSAENWQEKIDNLIDQYFHGAKIILFCNTEKVHKYAYERLAQEFTSRNIKPEKNNISIASTDEIRLIYEEKLDLFNWHSEIVDFTELKNIDFCIKNGENLSQFKKQLLELSNKTFFNFDQYFIEHTSCQKNILVRAGAGTGKTFTMVQRIAYLIAANNLIPEEVLSRFILITFTNDAADNMKDRLRQYYSNCYALTANPFYLRIVQIIDSMMISTIHAFSKKIIDLNCDAVGYGSSVSITSNRNTQWKKCVDIALENYIQNQERLDRNYSRKLNLQIYEIKNILSDFAKELGNKNIDILSVAKEKFGQNRINPPLHDLIYTVLQNARREYDLALYENNQVMLSDMILLADSILKKQDHTLKIDGFNQDGYLFIDEFQDTDDVQIEFLKRFVSITKCRMFVVGDLKQCIYRFRGAEEKAFDHLDIDNNVWSEFTLRMNYRTDKQLLDYFEKSFEKWGNPTVSLLPYSQANDRLISDVNINEELENAQYYCRLTANDDNARLLQTKNAIGHFEKLISNRIKSNHKLSVNDRTIAVLVRKNWQAQIISRFLRENGYPEIETVTGGNLFNSPPAIDLLALVNAFLYPTTQSIVRLFATNFFNLGIPKIDLSQKRPGVQPEIKDNRQQKELLIRFIDKFLIQKKTSTLEFDSWNEVLKNLRINPVLQVLKKLYSQCKPWLTYGKGNDHATLFYKTNADLIFETITQKFGINGVSLLSIHNFLISSIYGGNDLDCRYPDIEDNGIRYICSTVHMAKGLEYGFVVLPYCNERIDRTNRIGTLVVQDASGNIGYRITKKDFQSIYNSNFDQRIENRLQAYEETRILYVAMTRAISGFAWIDTNDYQNLSWQRLLWDRAI